MKQVKRVKKIPEHEVEETIFVCEEPGCDFECSIQYEMEQHMLKKHINIREEWVNFTHKFEHIFYFKSEYYAKIWVDNNISYASETVWDGEGWYFIERNSSDDNINDDIKILSLNSKITSMIEQGQDLITKGEDIAKKLKLLG